MHVVCSRSPAATHGGREHSLNVLLQRFCCIKARSGGPHERNKVIPGGNTLPVIDSGADPWIRQIAWRNSIPVTSGSHGACQNGHEDAERIRVLCCSLRSVLSLASHKGI